MPLKCFAMKRFLALLVLLPLLCSSASASDVAPEKVLADWYKLVLLLVRHTATYTPPVASRGFAYLGVTAYEATASGRDDLQTLAGQLRDLKVLPKREAGKTYDESVVLNSALTTSVQTLFANTGPTGQRALSAMAATMAKDIGKNVPPQVEKRSSAYGRELATAILAWAKSDGRSDIANMGFPAKYELNKAPGHWVPTGPLRLQQFPLLPDWGKNRTFAMPEGSTCQLPPPVTYSEDKNSDFFKQAKEVYDLRQALTPEQKIIARFWADDAMLTVTPPGHWVSIVMQIADRDKLPVDKTVDVLARLGVAVADSFIGCWDTKFTYDSVRPITYIKKFIDPAFETVVTTPPFPEYPSGHSTQSGAAATVLTKFFGENFAFDDETALRDSIPSRKFSSFWAAANEAGMSRLYAGIHFRTAVERGLEQGRCIGAFAVGLKTRK